MDRIVYQITATIEDMHWWFVGRRNIFNNILNKLILPNRAKIVDIGCGSGGNLQLLSQYGEVYGVEPDGEARKYALTRKIAPVLPGSLPYDLPFKESSIELIVMADVLEHIAEDKLSLEILHSMLTEGGYLLMSVPAFQTLWSEHDETHHHKRRYTKANLCDKVLTSGYKIVYCSYTNTIILFIFAMVRLIQRLLKIRIIDGLKVPPLYINKLMTSLLSYEGYFMNHMHLPLGMSLIILARKSPQAIVGNITSNFKRT